MNNRPPRPPTIDEAIELALPLRNDVDVGKVNASKNYVVPSLEGFSSEVIPFKRNNGGRPLYKLIAPKKIEFFNPETTKENNRYLKKFFPKNEDNARLLRNDSLEIDVQREVNNSQKTNEVPLLYLCIADKRLGREPGFESLRLDDTFWAALIANFSTLLKNKNLQPYLRSLSPNCNLFKNKFIDLLRDNFDFARDFSQYVIAINNTLEEPFIIWRFKQDYDEPNVLGNVGPKGRLKRDRQEENLNALREVINNDISTEMGYPTQVQQLKFSYYSDKKLKFLTANQLARNYQDLSSAYKLTGDKKDPNAKRGLFRNFLTKLGSHFGAKTQNPPFMGTLLAMQLFMEDPDFIGAYGQNKGLKDGNIFMIDLAKGLRGSKFTKIADSLQNNGHFKLSIESFAKSPFDLFNLSRHFLFRNSTMLYDVPFSENMMGFHILNQFVNGDSDPAIIQSFGIEFQERFKGVKKEGLHKIFEKHIENLELMKQVLISKEDIEEIDGYISEIEKNRDIAIENANRILRVFKSRLQLTAQELDLLSNLEKITSNTYDLTDDRRTQISHLQVETKSRIPWEITTSPANKEYVRLHCDLTKNPLMDDADRKKVKAAFEKLNQFLKETGSKKSLDLNNIQWEKSGKSAYIEIPRELLKTLYETEITDKKVHDYKVPLHSTESIIEATGKAIASFRKISQEKYVASLHSKTSLFSKKVGVTNPGIFIITKFETQFLNRDIYSNSNEQNIIKLMSTLGMLINKVSSDLTKQILSLLKADSFKAAQSRIVMQIVNELLILNPDFSDKDLASFIKLMFKNLNAYNTAIKKNHRTFEAQENLFSNIGAWFRKNVPPVVNRVEI